MATTSSMIGTSFHTGSTTHLTTLVVIAAVTALLVIAIRRGISESHQACLRNLIGWGCITAWILNTGYWMMPERLELSQSLPLQFCNLANIFGALAILKAIRVFQGILYFWSSLCVWAFLTPTTTTGLTDPGFWIFWIYHSFILFALVYILSADHFRPSLRDLLQSALFTFSYVILLSVINACTGWNYGFLGNDVPGSPTPVALLGPYPIRILWMILIGTALFVLLWLPFRGYSTTRTRK